MKMTADEFIEVLMNSGIKCEVRGGRVSLHGTKRSLIDRLNSILVNSPEFEAVLLEHMREHASMSLKDYLLELGRYSISYAVIDGRISLHGGTDNARTRCVRILSGNAGLEAQMILHEAANNPDLLDEIEERACMRWEAGYSDSLYDAVFCNIRPKSEAREYADTPNEKQAAFLFGEMGFSEEAIKDKGKFPSVWIKQKPRTDWAQELDLYRCV